MENKPLLSISIMVSNRMDTIRKCMESIKPLLTEIPCELVALDTVGEATDGSIDVVREYTDKIYRFEWCNDFAKARNFGLEKCTGEWFMFMDDDEWFEDVTEIVEFFKNGEYKKYNSANYKIHSYSSREGAYALASLFRMVKRTEQTSFIGTVHEYLDPILPPAKEFSAYIHHYGYVFESVEEERAHCERNIRLLEPDFKKNPWNMHVRVQMVQELMFMEELRDRAKRVCEETWEADKKYYKTNEFQWILVASLRMANREDDYEEIVRLSEMMRKRFPLSAFADLAISTMEVNARCRLEQYEIGAVIFEHALERRKYLLENPEIKMHLNTLDFATFLDDSVYCELLRSGIRCLYQAGKTEKAERHCKERFSKLKKPVLTVSVLVSNRIQTIRKCLESIKPLLDAVPSELLIVDTVGSLQSDGSLDIAKEYTDYIIPFVWCDDFAAARNAGLQVAKGEWFLYLDDDEWFESVEELIHFYVSGEYLTYNCATYHVHNYMDAAGKEYRDEVVGRMVRIGINTEFVGCINETFNNLYLPNKELSAYVHHYGFVYATQEQKQKRLQYMYQLLRRDLERYPTNLSNRARLAAIVSVENPEEAINLCLETLELCKEKKENNQYQWQFVVLFGLLENLQKVELAKEKYSQWSKENLILPVAEKIACYRMTRICIIAEEYANAYPYAKRYFELDEEVNKTEIAKEFRKYYDAENREEMLKFGAFCAWQAKQYEVAWEYYAGLSWESVGESEEDSMWKLFALAEEYESNEMLFDIVKRIMTNNNLKPILGKMMQSNAQIKHRVNRMIDLQKGRENGGNPASKLLSVGILVSNRKDTIRNCMESLKPLLDTIPSELIVLDTVGEATDGSADIVREYTNQVYPYEWCNNFADARNTCLSHASGEWFMYLDDDEWFEDITEIIDFFRSGEYKNFNSATYMIRNYKDFDGKEYVTAVLGRMVKRTENTAFIGTIHETFSEFMLPCKAFTAYVHHYGYAFKNEEEKLQHSRRNVGLLEKEFKENPTNLHIRTQMALELGNYDNEAAFKVCEETFRLCANQKEKAEYQWQMALVFRLYEALGTDYLIAEKRYEEWKAEDVLKETAELAIVFQLARICLIQAVYDKALHYLRAYFVLYQFLVENKELAQLQMCGDFARYQTEDAYQEMLPFAAFCAWQAGEYQESWNYYECMSWETKDVSVEEYMWKLFAMAEEAYNGETLFWIIKRIMTNDKLKPVLGKMMQSNPQIKQMINNAIELQRQNQQLQMPQQQVVQQTEPLYVLKETELFQREKEAGPVGELFEQYVLAAREHYEFMYQKECFTDKRLLWLPVDVRYNDILYRFVTGGKTDYPSMIEAAKLRPETAQLIKRWLGELTGR